MHDRRTWTLVCYLPVQRGQQHTPLPESLFKRNKFRREKSSPSLIEP